MWQILAKTQQRELLFSLFASSEPGGCVDDSKYLTGPNIIEEVVLPYLQLSDVICITVRGYLIWPLKPRRARP